MLNDLPRYAADIGVALDDGQMEAMRTYWRAVLETNRHTNLTRITEDHDAVVKHFVDSLTLLGTNLFDDGARVVDVGSGAGFPGVPLKIARPDLRITFVDSTLKRVRFLQSVIDLLGWSEAKAIHGRAEEVGKKPPFRAFFDVAVARAVAKLEVLANWCLPLLRPGGHFLAMKGPDIDDELRAAKWAIGNAGGEVVDVVKLSLPEGAGDRTIVILRRRSERRG